MQQVAQNQQQQHNGEREHGFSLVELSIVLVILGLLVGGILGGQALIRASELRSINTQINEFHVAINTFRTKYFALPGDMENATNFWGIAGGTTGSDTTCYNAVGAGTNTCNGNGDGYFHESAGLRPEHYHFWKHLANAGLIPGTYTGVQGPDDFKQVVAGENAPAAKISGVTFSVWYKSPSSVDTTHFFKMKGGNLLWVGSNLSWDVSFGPFLTPTELWGIDKKFDDGNAVSGTVLNFPKDSQYNASCTTTTDSTTSQYDFASDERVCSFLYMI